MSMCDRTHYGIVISLQLIEINEKKKKKEALPRMFSYICLYPSWDFSYVPLSSTAISLFYHIH